MTQRPQCFEWTVESAPGTRLDAWLSNLESPELSRSAWQRLIRERRVRVNGAAAEASLKLRRGDHVQAEIPAPEKTHLEAQQIDLEVLFEDDDLLVVNKAPGMAVHPGAGRRDRTLVNALLHHCAGQLSGIGGVERPGLVHRLDADTSGCLVVAKNDFAHAALAAQFKERAVEKIYLACVWGVPRRAGGRIEAAIGRHRVHRQKMSAHPRASGAKPALTEWKISERLGSVSLLECRLLTGRTHQIRVHCAHLGHPIVGDKTYGRARVSPLGVPSRQLLHAWKLSFRHPRSARVIAVEAGLPADFARFLEEARKRQPI